MSLIPGDERDRSHTAPTDRVRRHIIIAALSILNKFFFLDCEDGNVYVGTRNLLVDGEMMVCVPDRAGTASEEAQDGILRWLEHYAHCLHSRMFHVRTEEGSRRISFYRRRSLFAPLLPLEVFRTRFDGVDIEQVRCSGVFVPELSRVEELDECYWFSYSVCMRLLNPAPGQVDALLTCQLSDRHWVIRANDAVMTESFK